MIELLLAFAIGLLLGWKVHDTWTRIMIRELLEDMGLDEKQQKKLREKCVTELRSAGIDPGEDDQLPEVEIRIEKIQGQIFAYSLDDNEFMAQGKNKEELFNNLRARYKEIRCVVSQENGAELIRG